MSASPVLATLRAMSAAQRARLAELRLPLLPDLIGCDGARAKADRAIERCGVREQIDQIIDLLFDSIYPQRIPIDEGLAVYEAALGALTAHIVHDADYPQQANDLLLAAFSAWRGERRLTGHHSVPPH